MVVMALQSAPAPEAAARVVQAFEEVSVWHEETASRTGTSLAASGVPVTFSTPSMCQVRREG